METRSMPMRWRFTPNPLVTPTFCVQAFVHTSHRSMPLLEAKYRSSDRTRSPKRLSFLALQIMCCIRILTAWRPSCSTVTWARFCSATVATSYLGKLPTPLSAPLDRSAVTCSVHLHQPQGSSQRHDVTTVNKNLRRKLATVGGAGRQYWC